MRYLKFKKPEYTKLIKTAYYAFASGNLMKFKIYIETSFTINYEKTNHINYLICLFNLKKYKEFLYHFDKLEKADEINDLLFLKALCLKEIGKVADSIELFEYTYKVFDNKESLYALAYIYDEFNDYGISEDYYKKYLEVASDDINAMICLGSLYEKHNENEKALEVFLKALDIDSTFQTLNYNIAVSFAKLGRIEDAIKSYEEEIRINPDFSHSYLNLGLLYEDINLDKALEIYTEGIDKTNDSYLWYNVGCIYSRIGKTNKAKEYIIKSFELDPELIDYSKDDEDLINYYKELKNNS